MFTKKFWQKTAERAAKSFVQGFVAVIPVTRVTLDHVDWWACLSGGVLMGILSIGTSVASEPIGDGDSPSLVPDEKTD